MSDYRHETHTRPPFDCLRGACSAKGCSGRPRGDGRNHGIGSEVRTYATIAEHRTGPIAVTFQYSTGTYHDLTPKPWPEPMAYDLGFHSSVALYPDQWPTDSCNWFGDAPCYYDGSGLAADPYLQVLTEHGEAALWDALDARLTGYVSELDDSIRARGGVIR